jgi:hypothetical protein
MKSAYESLMENTVIHPNERKFYKGVCYLCNSMSNMIVMFDSKMVCVDCMQQSSVEDLADSVERKRNSERVFDSGMIHEVDPDDLSKVSGWLTTILHGDDGQLYIVEHRRQDQNRRIY